MDLLRRILLFFFFFLSFSSDLSSSPKTIISLIYLSCLLLLLFSYLKDICEYGAWELLCESFELWWRRCGVVGRRRQTTANRPAILLLNNIISVRRNENKHRFIIMTQNFLFHFHLARSLALRPFSDHTYDFFPRLLLLLRSPEQYSRVSLSPQPFIFISIWLMILERILFLMAFRSIIIQSLAYFAFLGFFWAF